MLFLFAFAMIFFAILSLLPDSPGIAGRLSALTGQQPPGSEPEGSLWERVWSPLIRTFARSGAKIAPRGQKERIIAELTRAGLNFHWQVEDWQGIKYIIALAGTALALVIAIFIPVLFFWRVDIVIVGFLMSYAVPGFWLKLKGKARAREIEETLPEILDLLTISVEAGLGFDAALLKVAEKGHGALAAEFMRVLQEIRMGRPRRDALRDLAGRSRVDDLKNFIAALVQADQLGIPIGGVMRSQARQIRTKRRQRVEEQAQKAPVKIMIPLVLFIFPSIFIVVLGPAVIQLVGIFRGN